MGDDDWLGKEIDGRYVVESVLGRGGMGVVLRAHHRYTGAKVALKTLRSEFRLDPGLEARFLAEARAPTTIGHPGIVQVLDAGKTQGGELYLAMELLEGESLRTAVTRGVDGATTQRIGLELLAALGAAHARGIVHRDLKPENVFLVAPHGTVKLLDFGIAKVVSASQTMALGQTSSGAVLGTLAYMAPEQLADASTVGPRADLWAMGVMLYELIAGRLPYRVRTVEEMIVALATKEPEPIRAFVPNVTPQLEAFFARALAREATARFGSTAEMAAALAALPLGASAPLHAPVVSGAFGTVATGYPSAPGSSQPGAPIQPVGVLPTVPPQLAATAAPVAKSRMLGMVLGAIAVAAIAVGITIAATSGKSKNDGNTTAPVAVAQAPAVPSPASPAAVPAPAAAPAAVPAPAPAPAPAPSPAGSGSATGSILDAVRAVDGTPPKPRTVERANVKRPEPVGRTPVQPQPQPMQPQPMQPQPMQPQPMQPQLDPAVQREQICEQGCQFLQARCGMRVPNTCLEICRSSPSHSNCFVNAGANCARFAQCEFASTCNGVMPMGGGSCNAAATCEGRCGNNGGCMCQCARMMSPAVAIRLFYVNACVVSCGGNQNCLQGCQPYLADCMAH